MAQIEQKDPFRPFIGRDLLIATMHGKERSMAPILEASLGVRVCIPENFDTDRFGTFCGEIPRTTSPLEATRQKSKAAFDHTGIPLIVASEGSFGPHPFIGFIPADEELVVLSDFETGYEYKSKVVSTATNFAGRRCLNWDEAFSFAQQSHFPAHGLIVRPEKDHAEKIVKGLQDWGTLQRVVQDRLNEYGCCYLETDMRAQYNPMRMAVIREATEKLITIIQTRCPACGAPGFEVIELIPGLPCSDCGTPTRSTASMIQACQACRCRKEVRFPTGKTAEDPMYCDRCNP